MLQNQATEAYVCWEKEKKKRVGDTTQQFCTEHLVGSWLDIDLFVWLWVLVSIVI